MASNSLTMLSPSEIQRVEDFVGMEMPTRPFSAADTGAGVVVSAKAAIMRPVIISFTSFTSVFLLVNPDFIRPH